MYHPSLKEARILAGSGEYRRIPVSRELLSDFITPIQALRVLRARSGHCFLLESAADSAGSGRYTFLGFDPALEVTCKDGVLRTRRLDTVRTEIQHPAPFLRRLLAEYKSPRIPGLPPLHRWAGGVLRLRLFEVRRAVPEPGRQGPGEVPGHGPDALRQGGVL